MESRSYALFNHKITKLPSIKTKTQTAKIKRRRKRKKECWSSNHSLGRLGHPYNQMGVANTPLSTFWGWLNQTSVGWIGHPKTPGVERNVFWATPQITWGWLNTFYMKRSHPDALI
jgi:hypothetical protein